MALLYIFRKCEQDLNMSNSPVTVEMLRSTVKRYQVPKQDFGQFWSSEEHADGTDQVTMCDFLLVYFSHWTLTIGCMFSDVSYLVPKSVGAKNIFWHLRSLDQHTLMVVFDWQGMALCACSMVTSSR